MTGSLSYGVLLLGLGLLGVVPGSSCGVSLASIVRIQPTGPGCSRHSSYALGFGCSRKTDAKAPALGHYGIAVTYNMVICQRFSQCEPLKSALARHDSGYVDG